MIYYHNVCTKFQGKKCFVCLYSYQQFVVDIIRWMFSLLSSRRRSKFVWFGWKVWDRRTHYLSFSLHTDPYSQTKRNLYFHLSYEKAMDGFWETAFKGWLLFVTKFRLTLFLYGFTPTHFPKLWTKNTILQYLRKIFMYSVSVSQLWTKNTILQYLRKIFMYSIF
jgi:hypothetical protein